MTDFLRTDVTAVKLINEYILAGIGSSLKIFHRDSFKLIQEVIVLQGQKIYGIVSSSCFSYLLVYGGKQFSFVTLLAEDSLKKWKFTKTIHCNDWLHSGIWVNGEEVALLTAHNVVQVWNINSLSLKYRHEGKDKSILYSGLLVPLTNDILVLSGTVYSEVIVQTLKDGPLHYLKGHKGVIFSIACNTMKGMIVTTSDDRSIRIWGIHNTKNLNYDCPDYWNHIKIDCLHELYGHTARVMRSYICDDCVISVGEDSGICFWSFDGEFLRKIMSHQNGCIWSLDADDKHLVTGGGDCAVILHPLSLKKEYGEREVLNLDLGTPKKIEITARRNLVFINEINDLVYYNLLTNDFSVHKLFHKSSYKMLSISSCKQIISVSDMDGHLDVFIENCKSEREIFNIISMKLNFGKILSMHWAGNRHLAFCSDNGVINIVAAKGNDLEVISTYTLPPCKERWLTAVALSADRQMFIAADRCGHIHVYKNESKNPVKTFDKIHGRYGATSISISGNEIITTGRDGSVKYFFIANNKVKYMSCKDVEFRWVEKFLDRNGAYVCGFQERAFVIFDLNTNTKMVEVPCGGGHRSWDAVRYIDRVHDSFEEIVKFVYVKNSNIYLNTFKLNKIVSKNVIHGTHSKEINCLKTIKTKLDDSITFIISGGEDTTLRISKLDKDKQFQDYIIFKQLSSIRSLKTIPIDNNRTLLLSAGGRAQICGKIMTFDCKENLKVITEEIIDYLIKGTDKERKGNQNWKSITVDFDPETRIMDLEIIKIGDTFNIFAGCSDAYLRTFTLSNEKNCLVPMRNIKYHSTCILKTHSVNINGEYLLVTCTTRGDVTFWDIATPDPTPILSIQTNKSGINCISSNVINEKQFVIATGGDDNSIHLVLLEFNGSLRVVDEYSSNGLHSSQITGLICVDDLLISTSIDQRVTLMRWAIANGKVNCCFISQTCSDVADIQGMDLLECSDESVSVVVFGKGIEVIRVPTVK